MALLVLLVSIALSTLVSTLAGAVVLRSLGVGVPRIDLGVWGPKVRFAARGSDVSLTPWLISGASTFKDVGNAERYADRPGTLFSAWSRPVRALVQLAGPAAVLAVADRTTAGPAGNGVALAFEELGLLG